jgi:thiol-disulfide isomerase/thioredoxin
VVVASRTFHLRVEGRLPFLDGATAWLNSPPLGAGDLAGRVVVVQFWTYTCINWLRTMPYVREWYRRYRDSGLVVVGVHTPEFPFEHDHDNVRRSVRRLGVEHPVAIDDDYKVWSAFANHFWPAMYVADARGRIVHHHDGEGDYEFTERVLQQLLTEAGASRVDLPTVSATGDGVEAPADWDHLASPENYFGAERMENFASPGGPVPGERHGYGLPDRLRRNYWALSGAWSVLPAAVAVDEGGGCLAYRFHARDVHLVMGPVTRGTPVPFRVRLDGQSPGAAHGGDVDDDGYGVLAEQRLHHLIRQPGQIGDRELTVEFLAPGAELYSATFG